MYLPQIVCACSVAQSCSTLCDPVDCSPPSSSVPGIFLAGILEWVAISYSRGSCGAFLFFFCFNFYWSVVDNVVLASRVQQSESVIHVHMYIYICIRTHIFLLKSFSLIVHYRALSRVPYAIQHILITYLFYVW